MLTHGQQLKKQQQQQHGRSQSRQVLIPDGWFFKKLFKDKFLNLYRKWFVKDDNNF